MRKSKQLLSNTILLIAVAWLICAVITAFKPPLGLLHTDAFAYMRYMDLCVKISLVMLLLDFIFLAIKGFKKMPIYKRDFVAPLFSSLAALFCFRILVVLTF